jgi:hypothetical protein
MQQRSIFLNGRKSIHRLLESFVRYRTAVILSFVLVGGMFGLPAIVEAVFLPSLKQGLPNPIPYYERILLEIALLCGQWRWFLALPIAGVLLIVAGLTSASRVRD